MTKVKDLINSDEAPVTTFAASRSRKTKTVEPAPVQHASTHTIRVWGIAYLIALVSTLADTLLAETTAAGIVRRDGSSYDNYFGANDPAAYGKLESDLAFWGRLAEKLVEATNSETAHKMVRVVGFLDGFTPKGMAMAATEMTGLPALEARQQLIDAAIANRSANESVVLAACEEDNTLTPGEMLQRYDQYKANRARQTRFNNRPTTTRFGSYAPARY